ncbi:type II toxin-antitoxin system HicB family antitoxin [Leptolyngbya sp. NIES-2104]|uniref:type II toxin-antitoxin system HicB family antitoxin n=1 Tax=Leptolyngbya sp. NIES-2104 TaxID=1552121 RepID=UPI00073E58FE|nr:type II toxin-antitoxin system HicB family antitoxin [Leptolyngbya sp. NIES-2104]
MKLHYSMVIQWSEEDKLYLVHLPEFPSQHFVTHGATYEEAAKRGQEVIEMLIEDYQESGKPLPEPQRVISAA